MTNPMLHPESSVDESDNIPRPASTDASLALLACVQPGQCQDTTAPSIKSTAGNELAANAPSLSLPGLRIVQGPIEPPLDGLANPGGIPPVGGSVDATPLKPASGPYDRRKNPSGPDLDLIALPPIPGPTDNGAPKSPHLTTEHLDNNGNGHGPTEGGDRLPDQTKVPAEQLIKALEKQDMIAKWTNMSPADREQLMQQASKELKKDPKFQDLVAQQRLDQAMKDVPPEQLQKLFKQLEKDPKFHDFLEQQQLEQAMKDVPPEQLQKLFKQFEKDPKFHDFLEQQRLEQALKHLPSEQLRKLFEELAKDPKFRDFLT